MFKISDLKKLLLVLISALLICAVLLIGCDNTQCLETVPFTLKERLSSNILFQNEITLIRNTDEFEEYLSNTSIFEEELSEEFKAVNTQYTEEYFENNYLVAIIKWAGYKATGYKLMSIEKQDGILYITLKEIVPHRVIEAAMGEKFTYYITVEKDETLTEAKLKYK